MSAALPFQITTYVPTTFLERGVLVPFTTPILVGSRVRPTERNGVELLVPNLSGGRGVYVLSWTNIHKLCAPTVHDRRLDQKVEALMSVTPGTIRQAAREVAMEGLAGREAQVAAARSTDFDQHARRRTNFLLLVALLDRVDPGSADHIRVEEPTAEREARAQRTILAHASRLGLPPHVIASDLERLAEVFSAVGVHGEHEPARIPRLLEMLSQVHRDTTNWGRTHRNESGALATLLADAAAATLTCAATTLRDVRALTEDVVGLVQRWSVNADPIIRMAARPDWLLDGWEQICLLWREASMPGAREAALEEMAELAPVLPRETVQWVRLPLREQGAFTYRRTVQANEDWRSGVAALDLVSRNERLRARSM